MDAALTRATARFAAAALAALGRHELAGQVAQGDDGAAADVDALAELLERSGR